MSILLCRTDWGRWPDKRLSTKEIKLRTAWIVVWLWAFLCPCSRLLGTEMCKKSNYIACFQAVDRHWNELPQAPLPSSAAGAGGSLTHFLTNRVTWTLRPLCQYNNPAAGLPLHVGNLWCHCSGCCQTCYLLWGELQLGKRPLPCCNGSCFVHNAHMKYTAHARLSLRTCMHSDIVPMLGLLKLLNETCSLLFF